MVYDLVVERFGTAANECFSVHRVPCIGPSQALKFLSVPQS